MVYPCIQLKFNIKFNVYYGLRNTVKLRISSMQDLQELFHTVHVIVISFKLVNSIHINIQVIITTVKAPICLNTSCTEQINQRADNLFIFAITELILISYSWSNLLQLMSVIITSDSRLKIRSCYLCFPLLFANKTEWREIKGLILLSRV